VSEDRGRLIFFGGVFTQGAKLLQKRFLIDLDQRGGFVI
jgi:hypothetical protein